VSRAAIPVLAETQAIARALSLDPLGMLASGSLLAAVPADRMEEAERVCAEQDIPFAWVGKLTSADRGFTLREGDIDLPLPIFTTDEVARALRDLGTQAEKPAP
jgi:hydrogenase expression/formation protein HypE